MAFTEIHDIIALRNELKLENQLLTWLEEFMLSGCDWSDEGSGYTSLSFGMISVAHGWILSFSLEEYDIDDKPFDRVLIEEKYGTVECYKLNSQFIIRTHYRGLITALTIFRDWVES